MVDYVTKFTSQFIKSVLELPGNTSYLHLITFDFNVDVDQSADMLESLFKDSVTNQKGRDIPLLCKIIYALDPFTFEAGVHNLELVQVALHRHKYTYIFDYHCDIMQLLLFYPDNLKKNLIDANKGTLSWSQLKDDKDIIVSTIKEVDQSLCDPLPTGKSVLPFNPSDLPLNPTLKSGTIVSSSVSAGNVPSTITTGIKHTVQSTLEVPEFLSQKIYKVMS